MTRDIDKVNGRTIRKLMNRLGDKVFGYLVIEFYDGDKSIVLATVPSLKQAREFAQGLPS